MIEKMAMGLVDQMAEEKMIRKIYNHWNYFANKCTD